MSNLKTFLVSTILEKISGNYLAVKRCHYGVRKEKAQVGNKVDDPKHGMCRAEEGGPRAVPVCLGRNDLCSVGSIYSRG